MPSPLEVLHELADSFNVQLAYDDDQGRRREADPEALLAVLGVLGAPLRRVEDAGDALRQRRQQLWRRPLEPVAVAWDGRAEPLKLRLPSRDAGGPLACRLQLEEGETRSWSCAAGDLPESRREDVEGVPFTERRLGLPEGLPPGYHRLTVECAGGSSECLLISSPARAYTPPGGRARTWGCFLPLYALRSATDWGVGDFTDLGNLIEYVQNLGGGVVGTLPMLAAFLDQPFEFSPYSPASRLFWNELYLDVNRELREAGVGDFRGAAEIERELAELRDLHLVDYQRVMALKRQALERVARAAFARPGGPPAEFVRFKKSHPRLWDYATFRAAGERLRTSWYGWPERMRAGDVRPGDYDESAANYHAYVQWLAHRQLSELSDRAGRRGPGLYLDLPLGVNPDGYDVWRERDAFAVGISGGAPPDSYFTKGQDWGFPPLHPENIRAQGYRYLRDTLRHHFQFAGVLRIDHMMGLHRLFWVPQQLGAARGVYVRYPEEELYAVFCLESNRNRAVLVGEDLGTVPPAVRPAMARHNVHRLYVAQYEMRPDYQRPFIPAPAESVACLNTHDMPTFAAYWTGLDIKDRLAVGYLNEQTSRQEEEGRQHIRQATIQQLRQMGFLGAEEDYPHILRGCLRLIATMPADAVLVSCEDLWQETEPQNVPGTWRERPNWRRRARHALEAFDQIPGLRETLAALDRTIRGA